MHTKLTRAFVVTAAFCILFGTTTGAQARLAKSSTTSNSGLAILSSPQSPLTEVGKVFDSAMTRLGFENLHAMEWPVPDTTINTPFTGEHAGIDIEGETGDPITAAASGTVTFAGDDGDGYGLKVVIRHDKKISTLYSHLLRTSVSKGPVARGDVIGRVGCTGSCSGDHLHFEVQVDDTPTNPVPYLKKP